MRLYIVKWACWKTRHYVYGRGTLILRREHSLLKRTATRVEQHLVLRR